MEIEAKHPAPLAVEEGIQAYASAMSRRFGPLFHLLGLGILLGRMRLEQHSAERIRRAADRGPLVYTLYSQSVLDLLALNVALNARRLPLAAFANRVRRATWLPLPTLRRAWRARLRRWQSGSLPDPVDSGWLGDLVATGANACLFMLAPIPLMDRLRHKPPQDVAGALVEAQGRCEAPIQVIPVVVIWNRAAPAARTEAERAFLGSGDKPGSFSRLWALLARRGDVLVQAGEPLDLKRFDEHYAAEPPARRARILRVALRRYLYREQSIVRGPKMRSHRWMRRLVLRSANVRRAVQQEIQATGQSEARVRKRVERTFDRIAARMQHSTVRLADLGTRYLWNRIYSGIDIREGDMDAIRQAQRRGTLVLLPCHRSHLDYLLLSSVLYTHNMALPRIAAGMNLSFWPAGPIFRRLGAFFIERSFKNDRLFPVVFNGYLRQLVREGFPLEFFLEGGRSRTGKLLHPRLGMLGMVLDAANAVRRESFDVTLLPINICYEQVAEERAYAMELRGDRKKPESFGDVLRARSVLRHRYGRVYLRAGQPIRVSEVMAGLDHPWDELDRDRRGEVLQDLGERVLHRINQQALVLPTSLLACALLAHPRRGIRRDALIARVKRFSSFLERAGAQPSASMAWPGWAVEEALRRFVSDKRLVVFEDQDGPVFRLAEDGRITLDFYKNTLLHFFVPASLLALALRRSLREHGVPRAGLPEEGIAIEIQGVERIFRTLTLLFRYEFVFDPDITSGHMFDQALAQLQEHGAVLGRRDGLRITDAARVEELANLLGNFVESYWLTLRAAHGLGNKDLDPKSLVEAIRKVGEGAFAVEEVRRSECLSTINLRNAVRAYTEEGLFRIRDGGQGLEFDETSYRETAQLLRELLD